MPFKFADFNESVKCSTSATKVLIPYSDSDNTELIYDSASRKYLIKKNGKLKTDMLTGESASFKNALILFADSITYELSEGTESVLDVDGSGSGYYLTEGGLIEIKWSVDGSGSLVIKTLSSEILTVNRGNTYISYFKSANSDKVTFE
jgi:hypothetical protein